MIIATDNGFCAAAQAATEALRAACADPADAVRLLSALAIYDPGIVASSAPIGAGIAAVGTAMGQTFRRAALTSLARACADYQPSSYDDAAALRLAVAAIFDIEILAAADAGQDDSYGALRTLRTAVIQDLIARGADLAALTTISVPQPLPSLVLAYRLYRDASRADDLTSRVDPVHPAWMPTTFQALNA